MTTEAILPVDPTRLEQLLRVQERLLLGAIDEATLADRLCQSTALVLGASGARLAALHGDEVATRGAYGVPFVPADDVIVRRALRERRPVLGDADHESGMLTLPIDTDHGLLVMQLRPWIGGAFGLEQVGLARYAASLAAVALKHARDRRAGAATSGPAEILASLSHDLRQPLNVMLGYTQLLIDDTYGACTSEQREVLSTIERHARELFTVLTGALDLVRLERQADQSIAEPFTAADVIEELCTGSLAHRTGRDVALTWHADPATPPFRSDRFRVRQILQNLIDNALRHTEHGEVAVTATPHLGRVRLEVRDTGGGIDPEDLPNVFAPFRTGTRGRTGSGLGLYIVKRFCEALRGDIGVTSTVGSGTRFIVDLPPELPARRAIETAAPA